MSGDATEPSGAPVALEFEIDGNVGELTVDAAGGTVRGASGELQLSAAEARAAREQSREMIGALQSGGLQAATSAGDVLDDAVALADTQYELWTKLGGAPLAVVMDTTTYHHAREALRGDLRAHNLLDLNLLAVAAVFFDYVLIQPDLITLDTEETEFTRIVRPAKGEEAHIEALHQVAVDDCARELGDLQDAWRTFLRDQGVELDLRLAPYGPQDDRYYPFSGQDLPSDPSEVVDYVTQQTVRAVFNDRVAGALRLPYVASSVRLPVSQELVRHHAELLLMLRRVLGHKPVAGAAPPGQFAPPEPIYAPLMLGVLLHRASAKGGGASVMKCMVELRDEMAEVREFLRYHPERGDWHEDPRKLLKEVSGKLDADLKKSGVAKGQKVGFTLTAGAVGAALGPAAALAVKVLQVLLPEDAAAAAAHRIFQREIFLLSDVTQEAAQITSVDTQVERVWGKPMDNATRKMLNRIASLNADALLRIGQA